MTGFPDKDKEEKQEDPNDIDASFRAMVKQTQAFEAEQFASMTEEEIKEVLYNNESLLI